jgi:hypothetical protein
MQSQQLRVDVDLTEVDKLEKKLEKVLLMVRYVEEFLGRFPLLSKLLGYQIITGTDN